MNIFFINPISFEWANYFNNINISNELNNDCDFYIFESNGDPIHYINHLKQILPNNKLVFILNGDQSSTIDNECIWFSNAVKPSGLCKYQTQIFVYNPSILKYNYVERNKTIDVFFKGTIWDGMRTEMFEYFKNKPNFTMKKYNEYWDWFIQTRPNLQQLEQKSFEFYNEIANSKISLCPKGNGNSSQRIIESLACKSVPVLINDNSKPFGYDWSDFCLVFFTEKHSWEYIENQILQLLNNEKKLLEMQEKGFLFYKNVICKDLKNIPLYTQPKHVSYGFSSLIVDKLQEIYNSRK